MTANNHGSLECVKGQWYIFYHRHTHNGTYSRQACAEPVTIAGDGSIAQAECTSCGLNGGSLKTEGTYPAPIACNITNGAMPHATNRILNADIPFITHSGEGKNAERFITNMKSGTRIVFKYFAFTGPVRLTLTTRGAGGEMDVLTGETLQGTLKLPQSSEWVKTSLDVNAQGSLALTLTYRGAGPLDLKEIEWN